MKPTKTELAEPEVEYSYAPSGAPGNCWRKRQTRGGNGRNQHATEEQISKPSTFAPKLRDLGISPDQSSQWQRMAEVPAQ